MMPLDTGEMPYPLTGAGSCVSGIDTKLCHLPNQQVAKDL
jgi:hypothetical protein